MFCHICIVGGCAAIWPYWHVFSVDIRSTCHLDFLLNARAMLLTLTVVAVLLVTYYFVIKWAFVRCVNHVLAASKRRSQRAGK